MKIFFTFVIFLCNAFNQNLLHAKNKLDTNTNSKQQHIVDKKFVQGVYSFDPKHEKLLYQFFAALSNKNFNNAQKISKKLKIDIVNKIQIWQQIVNLDTNNLTFDQVVDFIMHNKKWPDRALMIEKSEYFIKKNTNPELVLKWFAKYKPQTKKASLLHIKLLKKHSNKDLKYINQLAKSYWIEHEIEKDDGLDIICSKDDYIQKVNNYIWKADLESARKYSKIIGNNYSKNILLLHKIQHNEKNIQNLLSYISPDYLLSGLIYQYLQAYKNKIQNTQEIITLLKIASTDQKKIDEFAKLQNFFIRELLSKKQYLNAYKIASNNYMQTKLTASENEFLAGWISLIFLQKPKLALQHFLKFNEIVITYTSKAKGYYWIGRAYEELNLQKNAKENFAKSASYSLNFYGQISAHKMNQKISLHHTTETPSAFPLKSQNSLNEVQKAVTLLQKYHNSKLKHNQLLEDFVLGIIVHLNTREDFYTLFHLLDTKNTNENLYLKTLIGKAALQKGFGDSKFLFPTPYQGLKFPADKQLVYSIIKQESNFNKFAISRSNAYGLMQVIEPTGKEICKKLKIKFDLSKLKTDPIYNIMLGSNYITDRIREFQGSYILGIASYNAGPNNVKKWIKKHNDPRKMVSLEKVINWIELIPFSETRNYVIRVLENLHSYHLVLSQNSNFAVDQYILSKKK